MSAPSDTLSVLPAAFLTGSSTSAPPVWNRQFHRTFLNAHPERSTEEIMPKEAHEEAAKHHENAAKSHKTAAEHHGKGDTASAAKHSAEAHGHSTKDHERPT